MNKCSKCNIEIDEYNTYEYRGALACVDCFDDVMESRNFQRNAILLEEYNKTKRLKGLDLSDSIIGKANKKLLKGAIEVCSKESARLYQYERGE